MEDNDNILSKIKDAETESENILTHGEKNKEKHLAESREQALIIRNKADEKMKEYREKSLAKAREQFREKRILLLKDAERKTSQMKARVGKKAGKASDFLVGKFLEEVS